MTEPNKPQIRRMLRLLAKHHRTTPKKVRKALKQDGLLKAFKETV